MGISASSGYLPDASTTEGEHLNVNDCFGETDVFNLDGPTSNMHSTQRLRIRTGIAKTYWYLAVGAYAALILIALLST